MNTITQNAACLISMNVLDEMIHIADIHADRIKMAREELNAIFPVDEEKVSTFTQQDLLLIELLVSRFSKLQDFLGKKVINEFLLSEGEPVDDLTMLDKIHRLERLHIIESAELWKVMREIRNHVACEYPDNPALTAKYLNQIFDLSPKLLHILDKIKERQKHKSSAVIEDDAQVILIKSK